MVKQLNDLYTAEMFDLAAAVPELSIRLVNLQVYNDRLEALKADLTALMNHPDSSVSDRDAFENLRRRVAFTQRLSLSLLL